MAWTHFTAPLTEGQLFTAAMRAELLAALDERLKAVDATWGVKLPGDAEEDALAASGLATRKLYYRGPSSTGAYSLSEIHTVIERLTPSYLRPKFIEAGTGSSGSYGGDSSAPTTEALGEALTDLSAPSTTPSTWTATVLDTRVYWNMVREAIRLLRWRFLANITRSGGTGYDKFVMPSDFMASGLAAAIAAYAAEPEVLDLSWFGLARFSLQGDRGPGQTYDPGYTLQQERYERTLDLPTSSIWSSWYPACRPTWSQLPSGFFSTPCQFTLGPSELVVPAGALGLNPWVAFGTSTSAFGAGVLLAFRFADYDTGDNFVAAEASAPWVPTVLFGSPTGDDRKFASCVLFALDLAGRPAFTHPHS